MERNLGTVLLLSLVVGCVWGGATPLAPLHYQQSLRRDLFTNYVSTNRPANVNETIRVTLSVEVQHVDLDEVKGRVAVHALVTTAWKDPKLQWNASDYGGVDMIHLRAHEVWIPDLALYNTANGNPLDNYGSGVSTLNASGKIAFSVKVRLESFCQLDMKRWPMDTHRCNLKIGSWTHHGYHLDLNYNREVPIDTSGLEVLQFEVLSTETMKETKFYSCCEEPYVSVNYEFSLRRRSGAYKAIFYPLALAVVCLTLGGFWLPPTRGEKLLLNGVSLIVITFNILYFARHLSVFSLHIPTVLLFHISAMVLATLSTLISIFIISSARCNSKTPLPPGLKKLVRGPVGRLIGGGQGGVKRDQTEMRSADDNSLISSASGQNEWLLLAVVVDRVSFFGCCVVFVGFAACFI